MPPSSSASGGPQDGPSSSRLPSMRGPKNDPSLRHPGPPAVGRGTIDGLILQVKKGSDRDEVDKKVARALEKFDVAAKPGLTMFDGSFVYSLEPGFKETRLDEVSEALEKLPEVTSVEPDSQARMQ